MKAVIFLLAFVSFACSCMNNAEQADPQQFDKAKWRTKKANDYPYRDAMLDDLIKNITLKGLKIDSVLALLGPPTRTDADYLFYTIAQPHLGVMPISNKSLVIKFAKDSTVEWRKIHE